MLGHRAFPSAPAELAQFSATFRQPAVIAPDHVVAHISYELYSYDEYDGHKFLQNFLSYPRQNR